jgi:hypothetical protein
VVNHLLIHLLRQDQLILAHRLAGRMPQQESFSCAQKAALLILPRQPPHSRLLVAWHACGGALARRVLGIKKGRSRFIARDLPEH